MTEIQVRIADWQKDNEDIRRIRDSVFIAEQAVPPNWSGIARIKKPSTSSPSRVNSPLVRHACCVMATSAVSRSSRTGAA